MRFLLIGPFIWLLIHLYGEKVSTLMGCVETQAKSESVNLHELFFPDTAQ